MKKTKIITAIISTLVIMNTVVYAKSDFQIKNIDYTYDTISITGVMEADKSSDMTLVVIKKDGMFQREQDVVYVEERKVNSGTVEFKLKMPDSTRTNLTGEYEAFFTITNGETEVAELKYISLDEKNVFLDCIKLTDNIMEIMRAEENKKILNNCGLDGDFWSDAAMCENASNIFKKSYTKSGLGYHELIDALKKSELTSKFNKTADSIEREIYLNAINFSWNNINFNDMDSDAKGIINNVLYKSAPYTSISDMQLRFEEINAIMDFSKSTTGMIEPGLKEIAEKFKYTDDSRYKAYVMSTEQLKSSGK